MKLWMKLAAISLAVTLVALGACLVVFNTVQEDALKRADEERARNALSMYCMNVTSVVNSDTSQMQSVTLRSVVQYYFSSYAKLLQGSGTFYSLSQDGEYLFNTCPYKPSEAYGETEIPVLAAVSEGQGSIAILRIPAGKGAALVGACSFTVSGQTFDAYICMEVSETDSWILQMRWFSAAVLLFAGLFVAALTIFFMRFALRPIQKLTQTAEQIADGDYNQRTALCTKDEIGQLSRAFDRMALSIEDKIKSLDEQLQQKRLLLGALSHELKTPMTAVIGYADSLLHMPLNDEQRIACAQKIYAAGRHTEALSQKLMELISLTENGQIEKKRFPACRLAELLRENAPSGVRIACDPFELYGDETLLLSMVGNLIDNAVKASSAGAEVTVHICGGGEYAQITVLDAGCGIPRGMIDMVTEPFFRVDKARSRRNGGMGLGLALCKLIAERHGGGIAIESEPGKGTRVTVTLLQLDDIPRTS